jgi:transposase
MTATAAEMRAHGARSAYVRTVRSQARWLIRTAPNRKASWHEAAAIIENARGELAGMWVGDALHALRHTSRYDVHWLLHRSRVMFESVELGELSDRKRAALCALLRGEVE